MTVWQILALVFFGIPGLISFCRLIWSIRFKEQNYGFVDFAVLGVSTVVVLVAFLGVK